MLVLTSLVKLSFAFLVVIGYAAVVGVGVSIHLAFFSEIYALVVGDSLESSLVHSIQIGSAVGLVAGLGMGIKFLLNSKEVLDKK